MRLEPRPRVGDHRLDLRLARDPAQLVADLLRRRHQRRGIARAPALLVDRDLPSGHRARGLDHLAHREAGAVAEVVDLVHAGIRRALEPEDVRLPEVLDVDVIPDRGAVIRRVVRPEHGHVLPLARGGLEHERDQVRLGLVVLAEVAAGPRDVEVAQRDRAEPVRPALVGDHAIDRELRVPVGVDRVGGQRLGHGHLGGLAVDRAGRGEHEPPDARLAHRVEEVERRDEVAAVVALGVLDGLRDERERREVQHRVPPLGESGLGGLEVVEGHVEVAGALRDRAGVATVEVVEDRDLVARVDELGGHDGADVAGAAGHEELHAAESDTSPRYPGRVLVRLTGALMVALALLAAPSAGAAEKLSRVAQRVYDDYRSDAAIEPCAHTVADYRRTLREITPDIEEQMPEFRPAVEAALRERERSKPGCPSQGDQGSAEPSAPASGGGTTPSKPVSPPAPTPAPAPRAAPAAPPPPAAPPAPRVKPAPAAPAPTAAPTAAPTPSATPAPTTTPAPPVASATPAEAAGPILVDRPHHGTPAGVLIALGLLALALVAAALAALAARFGWGGERFAGARHAWGEAAYRAGGTWADFVDWLRLGGGPHRL